MQSNAARAAVAVVSIALVVILFVVLSGGDDEGSTTTDVAETTTTTTVESPGEEEAEKPEKPDEPAVPVIEVVGGEPKGGVAELTFAKGEEVRFDVESDIDEEVHVHGYDIEEELTAGKTTEVAFPADIDGVFEIELELSGVELAELTVNP